MKQDNKAKERIIWIIICCLISILSYLLGLTLGNNGWCLK